MKYILPAFVFALLVFSANDSRAQHCPYPTTQDVFHGNDIRTIISTSGHLFEKDGQAAFQVPYSGPGSPSAIFSGGLWLGGFDDGGNLKMAAQTFRYGDRFDYGAGPLTATGGTDYDTCATWDQVWSVVRNDIQLHILDFQDNGVIDDTIPTIFGWPGRSNAFFSETNGFEMEDRADFGAGFRDLNGNDRYEPDLGEYPHIDGVEPDQHPSVISWTVFNDNAYPHTSTGGDALQAEVQLTMYAFSCHPGSLLNETLFISYRVTNRSVDKINDLHLGQWFDADVGCYRDDYYGSYPEGNTFFAYNVDAIDGDPGSDCAGAPVSTYGGNPPVISATFLNRELNSFAYYNNEGFGSSHPATTDPQNGSPIEFYRYLTGFWRDGTPISVGGSGYNIPVGDETKFAFDGTPGDTSGWSMWNEDIPDGDRRAVGSVSLPDLEPGESAKVDLAFTFHQDSTLNNIETVTLMYDRLDALQELYDSGIEDGCVTFVDPCTDDCVYAGDGDHNGQVSMADYISTSLGQGTSGFERDGPVAFIPLPAEDWDDSTLEGVNYKHLDCNGDGLIDSSDYGIIETNYGATASWYEDDDIEQFGDDIQIVLESDSIDIDEAFFRVKVRYANEDIDSIYGLVFAFEFDTAVIRGIPPTSYDPLWAGGLVRSYGGFQDGRFEHVHVGFDRQNRAVTPQELLNYVVVGLKDIEISGGIDTTYFSITDVKAVLADGTLLPIKGQRVPVYILDGTSSVGEADDKNWKVFPNPSSGQIYIEGENLQGSTVSIVNSLGQTVVQKSLHQRSTTIDLAAGIYYVMIAGHGVEKIVVVD